MPHKALIITSNQQLCQDIEDSLQGLSLEFHHADGYMQALSMVARYHYKVADLLPSREDSYDRLIEEEHHQFALDEPSPENMLLQEEELHLLRAALLLLTAEEKELIDALFYQEMSEREYAQQIGLSQKGVNKRRHKILSKLRKIMKI